jgi:ABC-type glycerol-3-phosphate transport system substrate-binding protein
VFVRHRLGLFIGVLFTLVLAGCDAPRADTLRITGWISTPVEETLMRSMVDAFERRHPGSAVHYEPVTANYMDKLLLMLGTHTAPDIVMLEAFWAPSLVAYDTLMPLDKFVAQDPDFAIEDFEPAILNAFRFNGELYGLPKDYSTLECMVYLGVFYGGVSGRAPKHPNNALRSGSGRRRRRVGAFLARYGSGPQAHAFFCSDTGAHR